MASSPELFVVCKNCNSQVSPYITECPYCGTRLRKRAPKIERQGAEAPQKKRRKVPSGLGPLRSGEIPGIRGDEMKRPVMTIFLVAVGALWWLALVPLEDEGYRIVLNPLDEWWQVATAPFVHFSGWYQFAGLGAAGVFGWLLERRNGPLVVLVTWLLGASGGMAVVKAVEGDVLAVGATGGALALLCAWAVPPLLERRRTREDDDVDLLGPAVIFVLLVLMPVARIEISEIATGVGILAGGFVGLLLSRVSAR
ncbi:MAG TPA: rhomboid family intramembrane serine protease [Solirubrobacteraceae bacterium]|nr:rhomboid family intramembrane serine protease [Solirubrobacteraceae bacterium]